MSDELMSAGADEGARLDSVMSKLGDLSAEPTPAPAAESTPTVPASEPVQAQESGPAETQAAALQDKGQSEPEPTTAPAIEPPKFWSAEAREKFRALPADLQAVVAQQEEEAARARSRAIGEATDQRRAVEAERQAAIQERQRLAQALSQFVPQQARAFQQEFADVLSGQKSLAQMSTEDPARYTRFAAMRDEIVAAQHQQQAIQAQTRSEHLAREEQKLLERIPEWRDTSKGKAALDELRQFAVDTYGFTPQDVEVIGDHRYALILKDALDAKKLRQAQATIPQKQIAPVPPKVQKPGTGGDAPDRNKALLQRARQSTDLSDKADAIAALLTQG